MLNYLHGNILAEIATPPAQPCKAEVYWSVTQSRIRGMGVNICLQSHDRWVRAACYVNLFRS